ncbi:hypothetical protein [Orbus mooreae]|uniref:hypothetical protein n=1 Tax=Orbus mooreae TaxID=3074107 RepID=UPI00370D5AC3
MKYKVIVLIAFCLQSFWGAASNSNGQNNIKATIQQQIDNLNPSGNQAICYYVGDVVFPYQYIPVSKQNNRFVIWVNNELARRLDLFVQMGLLMETSMGSKHYDLTPIGQTYYVDQSFCFGKIELIEIELFNYQDNIQQQGKFSYQVKNIPDWAKSDIFTKYFYYYQKYSDIPDFKNVNFLQKDNKIPAFIIDEQSTLSELINFVKKVDGSLILETDIATKIYAFYDESTPVQFDSYKYLYDPGWGGGDKVLHLINRHEFAQTIYANNVLLLNDLNILGAPPEPTHFIKEIELKINNTFDQIEESLNYFSNGVLMSKYIHIPPSGLWSTNGEISRNWGYDSEPIGWYSKGSLSYSRFSTSSNRIEYRTNARGQIVKTHSNVNEYINGQVIYDEEDRVIRFYNDNSETKYFYANNYLVKIVQNATIPETNEKLHLEQEVILDENNKLVTYKESLTESGKKTIITKCQYSEFNEQGDWTRLICEDETTIERKLSYYRDDQLK